MTQPNQYEDKELTDLFTNHVFAGRTLEEINKLKKSELDKLDDLKSKVSQLITQKQLEAQKLQVGGFKSDLLKMKQGYFDVDYLIDSCDFELAELTKQEDNS